MLYKVTPMLPPPGVKQRQAKSDGQARKRRATGVYDAEGNEVLITLMCLKCKTVKPLAQFGLRKMADGAIRNQPWCRPCRSGAGTKPRKGEAAVVEAAPAAVELVALAPLAVHEGANVLVPAERPDERQAKAEGEVAAPLP